MIQGNCGSITPGVLRSIVGHIPRVRAFTLGLSYSLTDDSVFSSLADLPALRSLQLRYYMVSFLSHTRIIPCSRGLSDNTAAQDACTRAKPP